MTLETVKPKLNDTLPPPHNGPCDKYPFCHHATQKCREPISDYPLDWKDWESTPLRSAPNRRWIDCAGWAKSLGMVFDKESGRWVYPVKPEHFGYKEVKRFGEVSIAKKKEE